MTKCSECKYGVKKLDTFFDEFYFECQVDGDWISEDIAENEILGCDLYANRNDDITKRP